MSSSLPRVCRWSVQRIKGLCQSASTTAMNALKCTVCNVTVTSEKNIHDHLHGRVHIKMVEKLMVSEKSVYIRGFPPDISSKTLQSFLEEKVGVVQNLWMSHNVQYALVEFSDTGDALKALQMPRPTLAGKKIVIKPRILRSEKARHQADADTASHQADADSASQQQKRKKRKSVREMIEADILKIPKLNDQLIRLSELDRMSKSAHEDQLHITFQLLREMRMIFPHCLLVPFGSTISGLSTKHSDCDLCLVPTPPASLPPLLTGKSYFSPHLLSTVKRLESQYGVPICPPPMTAQDSAMNFMTTGELSRKERMATFKPFFTKLQKLLYRMPMCSQVLSLPGARCPIIRFVHKPTSLHCDVCIDNILGPLNSRLVKAYCEFDKRVPVLVLAVKFWAQNQGFPRKMLNSYALSLMCFYFLQRCTPPLLPCLQAPHMWQRNAQWYQQKKFEAEIAVEREWTAPWEVTFTEPDSLLPSSNVDSAVSLLLKFFQFYGHEFDFGGHVVSIRTHSNWVLTREGALQQMARADKDMHSKVAPLVVQDPFDLSHNVTKLLCVSVLKKLCASFRQAHSLLSQEVTKDRPSILSLFDEQNKDFRKCSRSQATLVFTLQNIVQLLAQGQGGEGVAQGQGEEGVAQGQEDMEKYLQGLDLSSVEVRHDLGKLVLGKVLALLSARYGFTCEEVMEGEGGLMGGHGGEGEGELMWGQGGEGELMGVEEGEGQGSTMDVEMEVDCAEEPISVETFGQAELGGLCGTKRAPFEGEEELGGLCGTKQALFEAEGELGGLCGTKRALFEGEGEEEGELGGLCESKRIKTQHLTPSEPHPQVYVCTACNNTWVHARRARRARPPGGSGPPLTSGSDFPGGAEVVLQLQLTQRPLLPAVKPHPPGGDEDVCAVVIERLQGDESDYYSFYGVIKKVLRHP